MWLFVPLGGCYVRQGERTIRSGLYIFPLEGCFLFPPSSLRARHQATTKGSRRATRRGRRPARAWKCYQITRRPFFLISGKAREYWFISWHAQKSPKVYSISSTSRPSQADLAGTGGVSRPPDVDAHLMISRFPPLPPRRVGNTFPDRKIEALDIQRLRLRLSCLFHLLYTYLPIRGVFSDAWWTSFHYHYVRANNSIWPIAVCLIPISHRSDCY